LVLDCWWLIDVPNAVSVNLRFTDFETEEDFDLVTVYDGNTQFAPVLAILSGEHLQQTRFRASSGQMLIHFSSDSSVGEDGFRATYSTTVFDGKWNEYFHSFADFFPML